MESARAADKVSMSAFPGMPTAPGTAATSFEARLQSKILASLFAAGAGLVLLTLLLPHSPQADELGLLAICANAFVVAGVLWRWGAPRRIGLPLTLAWGSTLIAGVAYFSGDTPSPMAFFYLWVFLYCAYFFTEREAIAQILYAGATYAALLDLHTPQRAVGWWLVAMGAMLVAALVIRTMRVRVEGLIGRLYDAARTDPLTALPNRRGFRELLDLELERARRGATVVTLLSGDLDAFKEVNDRCGHHVGDAVLKRVSETLREGVRQIDVAARVGGEEFALVLPGTDADGAYLLAERLRAAVRDACAGDSVPVTISFGVASYPQHGETAASLLRAADEALYGAKAGGRDRTLIHAPELAGLLHESDDERELESDRFLAAVLDLAEAVDVRFSGSARHSETVGRYAEMMARELGLSERHVARVRLAGMLHDLGKVGVPDAILRKPGGLTDEELDVIRRHPRLGAEILEHPSLADVQAWVGAHHERPDGRGYPQGLAGEALPLEARILAVADAYEAMTSDRAYRGSIGHEAARAELERGTGTQFDERVVRAFLRVLEREGERAEALLAEPSR